MQDQLLGYLLGALDDDEHAEVQRQIDTDIQLQRKLDRLRRCCEPLECDREHLHAPVGLARRTCYYVESYGARALAGRGDRGLAAADSTDGGLSEAPSGRRVQWRLVDVAVAAGILIATTILVLPAVSHSRFTARLVQCQNNLREIGLALHRFSHENQGLFPADKDRRLSAAAVFAPILSEQGYLTKKHSLTCPGSGTVGESETKSIPSMSELQAANGQELEKLLRNSPVSYGVTLGYMENGIHRATRNRSRATFALLSDSPCPRHGHRQSSNHNGLGQNVCYEDLHTDFRTSCNQPSCRDKNFYRNDEDRIAPGLHHNDAVIVRASTAPLVNGEGPRP